MSSSARARMTAKEERLSRAIKSPGMSKGKESSVTEAILAMWAAIFMPRRLQNLAADRPGEHQRRRQTPGKMAAAPDVVSALIADVSGIIGVARPGQHRQIAVIPRTDVVVAGSPLPAERRSGCRFVRRTEFLADLPPCGEWRIDPAGSPAGHLSQNLLLIDGDAGGQTIQHHADPVTVWLSRKRFKCFC